MLHLSRALKLALALLVVLLPLRPEAFVKTRAGSRWQGGKERGLIKQQRRVERGVITDQKKWHVKLWNFGGF